MSRFRHWLAATHGTRFELVRHFLGQFFESDLVTSPDQWLRVLAGVAGVLFSVGILIAPVFLHRYDCVNAGMPMRFCPPIDDYRAQYLLLLRSDTRWAIALAFCITGLVTAIQWQSLFPTLRDCLALAAFPVSALEIFWSKLAAAVLALAAFVTAINIVPSVLFAGLAEGRWQQHSTAVQAGATFAAATAACVFVFFSMLAIQGLLLNLLPPRRFERVSVYAQSILFTANVAALPFLWSQPEAMWWPPNWFIGLWSNMAGGDGRGARYALAALIAAPAIAIFLYVLSYHRYQRLLIEIAPDRARKSHGWRLWPELADPHEQAVFSFLWKTITRSRLHRLMLQVSAGLAIAWIIAAGGLQAQDEGPVLLVPLAVSVFLIAGLRYLFSLPSELRANWLFQITESEGRVAWLRAMDKFVIGCGLGLVYACSLPASIAVFGFWQAIRVTLLGFFLVLLVFEFLFREWCKAPFTCSYLPGKRMLWQILVMSMAALSYLGTAAAVIHAFSGGWVTFAAAFPLLFGGWRWMRRRRTESWPETPLVYDELPEPVVSTLDIGFERGRLDEPPAAEPLETRKDFRNWDPVDERDVKPFFHPSGVIQDMRYGLRLLRKNLPLAATIVATLTLGIGVNVSVFTLLNAVAFRPRVPDPGSFVRVSPVYNGDGLSPVGGVTSGEYLMYRNARSLRGLAASFRAFVTVGSDRSSSVPALLVSCNFFSVYGAERPRLGRFFRSDECVDSSPAQVVVISEESWRTRFGADPQIVGRLISLDDERFTVIGVAPAESPAQITETSVWIPYTTQPLLSLGFEAFRKPWPWLWIDGRLGQGVSRGTAEAELTVLAHQLDAGQHGRRTTLYVTDGSMLSLQPILNRASGVLVRDWVIGLVMVGLGMVLCITCANVMTLLLSRAVARRREIGVRLAMGAPPARLLRMLLAEGFLLAAAAGALSLYISYRVPSLLFQFLEHRRANFPLAPDWRIFAYIFGVTLLAACTSALAPALESLKVDLATAMKGGGTPGSGMTGAGLRTVLVTAQVAMSLALLVGAGMLLQGYRAFRAGPGYDTRHVLAAPLRFPAGLPANGARSLSQTVLARIQALPGVSAVSACDELPFNGPGATSARFADRGFETARTLSFQPAAPGLLATLGIGLLRGRDFRESDVPDAAVPASVIVSEKLARMMSPHDDPVGRMLETRGGTSYHIVGIARDVKTAVTEDPVVWVFNGWSRRQTFLMARFAGDARAAEDAFRGAVRNVRADMIVTPRTLQSRMDDLAQEGTRLVGLILVLALLAMTLSVAGIYGVISFTVTQKTHELGIRMALGAQRSDIFREVLISGGRPVLLGLFAGLWLALGADSMIRGLFLNSPFQLDAANPEVYLGAALVLGLAALVAMFFPARRGARSDPMRALHYE